MRVARIDPKRPDSDLIAEAARILRRGGLVAFPTETVYGLGANALDASAVQRIYDAKGRPSFNPLIAHVASLGAARDMASDWPEIAERLGAGFWPGPLTLVVPKRPDIPDLVTAGLPSVALRVPAHPVAHALLDAAGVPVAAPSANRFTEVSPTRAEHVVKSLGERVELVLDGGRTGVGIESTVIDVTGERPVLLRPGSLSREELERVVGPLRTADEVEGSEPRPSPGMVRRHYSPRARLLCFPTHDRPAMERAAGAAVAAGERVGALLFDRMTAHVHHAVEMPRDPAGYARELYAALHDLDDLGCTLILADAVPSGPEWAGIRDRLGRAAHRD